MGNKMTDEQLSKINQVYEALGELIIHDDNFRDLPIYWSMFELTANEIPPTCIVFGNTPFQYSVSDCSYETQLDIFIIHNTDYVREIHKRLSKYAELMLELINNHIENDYAPYELQFLQGSEIRATQNNRKDTESYKGSKMLYSSLIVLTYNLRY